MEGAFWVSILPRLSPTNRRTHPLAGACACLRFGMSWVFNLYRSRVYKLDVLLPFSLYLGCFCIQPVHSNSFSARLTVEQDSPRSEAIVFTPGQQDPETAD